MKILAVSILFLLSACASTPEPSKLIPLAQNLSGKALNVPASLQQGTNHLIVSGLTHQASRVIHIDQNRTSNINITYKRVANDIPLLRLFPKKSSTKSSSAIDHSFSFYQTSLDKTRTKISCVDKEEYQDLDRDSFSITSRYDEINPFACFIQSENSPSSWLLKLNNIDTTHSGSIQSDLGLVIDIHGIKRSSVENIGYEYSINGKSVALLSMVKQGRVTIKKNLSAEIKQIILSSMSALIVEYGLIL
ncbi:MAG: hypothetical protein ISR69_01180 [Gammaproteobacteria bacterium]|nr:hypothetical protein [Gammaproteobacteria bacterium]